MSNDPNLQNEYTESPSEISLSDVTPASAYAAFCSSFEAFEAGGSWDSAVAAYRQFAATLSSDERSDLWKKTKALGRAGETKHLTAPLFRFGRVRERIYQQSPRRRKLDKQRSTDPARRQKVQEYQARYREKKRAEKLATKGGA